MSMSAYEVTIPTMLRGLGVLDHYLDEASKLTASHDKSITDVLGARLAPDMLNFAEHINIACSKAERHAAALCQLDRSPTFPVEPTLEALRTRLRETQRFLESLPQADFSGSETRIYWLSEPLVDGWLCASDYVLQLVVPDFLFHVAMAHAILRHLGSSIGKRDYLGQLSMRANGYD
ncbi:MAG TPA: DUF1993 domain-containing protein [Roseiarcus sp.]